jgi:hypothetical protein
MVHGRPRGEVCEPNRKESKFERNHMLSIVHFVKIALCARRLLRVLASCGDSGGPLQCGNRSF